VFKKELLDKIGGFNAEYDGAQDFDIILRATEKAKKIIHIPKVLYYWRIHKGSTSMQTEAKPYAIEAGRKAVAAHLERIGLKGTVFNGENTGTYGIDYDVIGNPKVSILIPNKDGIDLLETCINSVLEKTTYSNYEIIIVENNSDKEETFEYYKRLIENEKIKVINYNKNTVLNKDGENELPERIGELKTGFNYSSIINFGVRNSDGDFIVQLNNDTELITPNWLERMIGFCQRDDVGAVGVKLYYPDETIQHAGIIVGCLQVAAHVFRGLPKDKDGYFGREKIIQNMNAVTAACIMTKRSIYEEVGYMNEEFAVAFNDIDFCLRIRQTGKLIVYNPYVEFVHYESKTRGNDNDPDKIERFQGEINLFLNTWKDKLEKGDEYYNPNLSLDSDQYEIKVKGK
jgi:GT2 family glycosyltransferase